MLNKEECLFERDEAGELLGKRAVLETIEGTPEVMVRPLTRGKLMSVYNRAKDGTIEEQEQADVDLIVNGLIDPVLTKEEIINLRPNYALAISAAILSISLGKEQKEITQSQQVLAEEELSLKK